MTFEVGSYLHRSASSWFGILLVMAFLSSAGAASGQQDRRPYGGANPFNLQPNNRHSTPATIGSADPRRRDVRYSVTAIGAVPGKESSFLPQQGSINDDGVLAGYSYNGPFGGSNDFYLTAVAFSWEHGTLHPLPLLAGWPGAFAYALNNGRQIIGTANKLDDLGNIVQTPIMWVRGTPFNLGIPAPYSTAEVIGVNNRADAVGYALRFDTGEVTPFVWHQGHITSLPIPSGGVNSFAERINDRGEITGVVDYGSSPPPGSGEFHSVLWRPRGGGYEFVDIGGFEGYFLSFAFHINNRGQVVGTSTNADGDLHAYLWDGGPLQDLGTLPGGGNSEAQWNNEHGQILGYGVRDDGNLVDILWQNGAITDLNELVPPGTPLLNQNPGGINERGQIAATAFLDDGSAQAFLLTPMH